MPGSSKPARSHTTPPPKAITPLEAREFGEKLDDAVRAQRLCAAELSRWFDFGSQATLLGAGSFGSVRFASASSAKLARHALNSRRFACACQRADGGA